MVDLALVVQGDGLDQGAALVVHQINHFVIVRVLAVIVGTVGD